MLLPGAVGGGGAQRNQRKRVHCLGMLEAAIDWVGAGMERDNVFEYPTLRKPSGRRSGGLLSLMKKPD